MIGETPVSDYDTLSLSYLGISRLIESPSAKFLRERSSTACREEAALFLVGFVDRGLTPTAASATRGSTTAPFDRRTTKNIWRIGHT
jgi:hypothetical protein